MNGLFKRLIQPALALAMLMNLHVAQSLVFDEPIDHLRIRWTNGAVKILPSESRTTTVALKAWGPEALFSFSSRSQEGFLILELPCRTALPCGGDLEVRTPRAVSVDVDLTSGSAVLTGLAGKLTVVLGKGSIVASKLLSQDTVVQVAKGRVDASWIKIPRRVVAASAMGDVRLQVPNATYSILDRAGNTQVDGVLSRPESSHTIQVTSLGGAALVQGIDMPLVDDPRV